MSHITFILFIFSMHYLTVSTVLCIRDYLLCTSFFLSCLDVHFSPICSLCGKFWHVQAPLVRMEQLVLITMVVVVMSVSVLLAMREPVVKIILLLLKTYLLKTNIHIQELADYLRKCNGLKKISSILFLVSYALSIDQTFCSWYYPSSEIVNICRVSSHFVIWNLQSQCNKLLRKNVEAISI